MKSLLTTLLMCLVGGNTFAQNNAQKAIDFVTHLIKEEYTEAVKLFDPSISSALNAEVLHTGWQQIQNAYGKYKSYYVPVLTDSNANSIVLGVQFEKGEHGFSCNFNDKHQLLSFTLAAVPVKAAEANNQARQLYEERQISVPVDGGALKGTIMLPANGKVEQYVLIISGSGPTDRDGNSPLGVNSNSYKLLAEALANKGIASLRYDKRLIAASNGFKQDEALLRFDDYAQDAIACIQFLKNSEHAGKIYIAGHSEGSLLGILATQKTNVDGYISICGAGENIANILQRQLNRPEANPILDKLRKGEPVTDLPSDLAPIFRPAVQPFLISWIKYEPTKEIAKLKIPVLIIGGTTDIQVPPSDAELLHNALPKSELLIVSGMNHVLKNAPADQQQNIATYTQPDLPLNSKMVEKIIAFLKQE